MMKTLTHIFPLNANHDAADDTARDSFLELMWKKGLMFCVKYLSASISIFIFIYAICRLLQIIFGAFRGPNSLLGSIVSKQFAPDFLSGLICL